MMLCCRPILCKLSMLTLFRQTLALLELPPLAQVLFPVSFPRPRLSLDREGSYFMAKQDATAYQAAKHALSGEGGPFSGWVKSGRHTEEFNWRGERTVPWPTTE